MTCLRMQEPNGKRLSAKDTHDHKPCEMHNKHDEPDGEHNAKSFVVKETQYPFECAVTVPRSRSCCDSHQNTQLHQSYGESNEW